MPAASIAALQSRRFTQLGDLALEFFQPLAQLAPAQLEPGERCLQASHLLLQVCVLSEERVGLIVRLSAILRIRYPEAGHRRDLFPLISTSNANFVEFRR
jgi:hypothetical protein